MARRPQRPGCLRAGCGSASDTALRIDREPVGLRPSTLVLSAAETGRPSSGALPAHISRRRFILEFVRGDERLRWLGFSVAQELSIGLFTGGVILWLVLSLRKTAPE